MARNHMLIADLIAYLLLFGLIPAAVAQTISNRSLSSTPPACKRFDAIYLSGKELCENMWGGAFKYEVQEEKAYTMWFFDKLNPNNAVAQALGKLAPNANHQKCHLDYFHKDTPGPEPDAFTECHPWKERACCAHGTVETAEKLKKGYGKEYEWDRCGPLSPECERFFVQEACFYECDPNAGLYRKWHPDVYDKRCDEYSDGYDKAYAEANSCAHNAWQMSNMPIKASYCDAWWTACRQDLFCAAGNGDYFSCAKVYEKIDEEKAKIKAENAQIKQENEQIRNELDEKDDDSLKDMGLPIIVALAAFALIACVGSAYLISREKSGKPVFAKLLDGPSGQGATGAVIGNTSA